MAEMHSNIHRNSQENEDTHLAAVNGHTLMASSQVLDLDIKKVLPKAYNLYSDFTICCWEHTQDDQICYCWLGKAHTCQPENKFWMFRFFGILACGVQSGNSQELNYTVGTENSRPAVRAVQVKKLITSYCWKVLLRRIRFARRKVRIQQITYYRDSRLV